jgi:coenzyme F420-reducing hydrogenase delta subunit/heterodisulfide reductase subunit C
MAPQLDRKFRDEVMAEPGGEHLLRCLACGTCMAACLIRRTEPEYNPRRILHMVAAGLREEVLSSPLVWLCSACDACYKRCPQDIHISELMGAIKRIATREGYEPEWVPAVVNEETCFGCGLCTVVCPYEAAELVVKRVDGTEKTVAQVDKHRCMTCGICAAACLTSSITIEGFTDADLHGRAEGELLRPAGTEQTGGDRQPQILLFICDWCLRAESDLAYLSQCPPAVRTINVPCSGRVNPLFITTALQKGIDGVLVIGCQEGECHYKEGNLLEKGRLTMMKNLLDFVGIEDDRVQFAWIGSSERGRLPQLVDRMIARVGALGPGMWRAQAG